MTIAEVLATAVLATPMPVAEFHVAVEGGAAVAQVIIRHPKTSHEVGIELRDFRTRKLAQDKNGEPTTYEAAGYRIVSLADGSPYEQPNTDH